MKRVVVLSFLVLLVGSWVYFQEFRWAEQREAARELQESLFRLKREELTQLAVIRPSQPDLVLVKQGETWVLREPVEAPADEGTLDQFLRALETARRERTLSGTGPVDSDYGLDQPELMLRVQAGSTQRNLRIGKRDFSGNSVYVRFEGEQEVHLTPRTLLESADKDLFSWREKRVLDFQRDGVEEIRLENSRVSLHLKKTGEEWYLESPIRERADQSKVGSLLATVEFAEAESYVAEDPEDLREYGLEAPAAVLRLGQGGGATWRVLELGSRTGEDYFGRNPSRPAVFTVSPEVYSKLTDGVWTFRDKEIVDVPQDQVSSLSVVRPGESMVLHYEDYRWTVQEPEAHRGREVRAYQFWYPIQEIQFDSIEDDPDPELSLDPEVRLEIALKDGGTRSFRFGRNGKRYWALKLDSGRQGTIAEADYQKLLFKLEDLLEE